MRVETGARTFAGRAVDLEGAADPRALVEAIRGEPVDCVVVECPDPGAIHDHVGHVREGMSLHLRGVLATAARSLGKTAPQRDEIEAVRAELSSLPAPEVDLKETRRRIAAAGESEERLRERVATLRGRVQTLDGTDEGYEAARADLREAARELAEAETERIAAEQRHDRLEAEARSVRDRRERRLELQDRAANLERAARRHLAATVYDRFRSAVAALPGEATAGEAPGEYEGDPVTGALAVARIGAVEAPLVVATDRLGDASTAARRLDAPVIRP